MKGDEITVQDHAVAGDVIRCLGFMSATDPAVEMLVQAQTEDDHVARARRLAKHCRARILGGGGDLDWLFIDSADKVLGLLTRARLIAERPLSPAVLHMSRRSTNIQGYRSFRLTGSGLALAALLFEQRGYGLDQEIAAKTTELLEVALATPTEFNPSLMRKLAEERTRDDA